MRKDYSIILQSHLPYRHHYLDHATGLVWQGYEPYRWRAIAREAAFLTRGDWRTKVRAAGESPFKVAFNLRAHRRQDNRRFLYVAAPNVATHLESEFLAPGRNWAALIADETQRWFDDGGLAGPGEHPRARNRSNGMTFRARSPASSPHKIQQEQLRADPHRA